MRLLTRPLVVAHSCAVDARASFGEDLRAFALERLEPYQARRQVVILDGAARFQSADAPGIQLRSAIKGSTPAARRAGIQHANAATAIKSADMDK